MLKAVSVWPWLAAIGSGLLYAACFAPWNQAWLCWIALTPLIAAVWFSPQNGKRRWLCHLLLGYVAGIVFFTTAFSWLGSLGVLYNNIGLRGLSLLLSIYLGFYTAFWAWFVGLIRPRNFLGSLRNLLIAFLGASAWAAHEWVRGWLFTGFGWNGLGVAIHDSWPLIQVAEFTGVAGLSFVITFANVIAVALPVRLYQEARGRQMHPHFDLTLTLAALVGLALFGLYSVQMKPVSRPLRLAAVQANVPQQEKFEPDFSSKIYDRFARLTEIALHSSRPPELIIWPESAMPDLVLDPETESHRFVLELSRTSKTDLLLGTIEVEERRDYNAAVLISGDTHQVQVYRKVHLVPFGEYIPLRRIVPLFPAIAGRWVPGDFEAGSNYTVFRVSSGNMKIAPLICFEDTIGDLSRQFVLNGANLLVNMTNDGWFLRSAGSRQHLDNAIFRCVETRRPMARAANTGVTCFINQFGRITQILQDETGDTFAEGVLSGELQVPTAGALTFYVRHGELFAQVCAIITLLAITITWLSRRGRTTG